MAESSFLGSGGASWLYGLVGPVLIGGLAYLSKSKLGKGAAYGLMMTWAVAMASITASDKSVLDRAQGYFAVEAVVLTHEQAVAAARIKKESAHAELNRVSAAPTPASELLADAENAGRRRSNGRRSERARLGRRIAPGRGRP